MLPNSVLTELRLEFFQSEMCKSFLGTYVSNDLEKAVAINLFWIYTSGGWKSLDIKYCRFRIEIPNFSIETVRFTRFIQARFLMLNNLS